MQTTVRNVWRKKLKKFHNEQIYHTSMACMKHSICICTCANLIPFFNLNISIYYFVPWNDDFFLSIFAGRTPDSPDSIRAVAPRSPISPKAQYTSLTLQRTTNGSTSPIQKGGSSTPPQTSSAASTPQAATPILLTDTSKELSKLRKFLGALYQFGQDTSNECGDRVRSLILSLVVRIKSHRKFI